MRSLLISTRNLCTGGFPVLCRCILRLTERQPVAVTEFSGRLPGEIAVDWAGKAGVDEMWMNGK